MTISTTNEYRLLRRYLRLTQVKFAAEIGVAKITVSRWERNLAVPSPLAKKRMIEMENEHRARQIEDAIPVGGKVA